MRLPLKHTRATSCHTPFTDLPVDDNIALLQCNTEVSKRPNSDLRPPKSKSQAKKLSPHLWCRLIDSASFRLYSAAVFGWHNLSTTEHRQCTIETGNPIAIDFVEFVALVDFHNGLLIRKSERYEVIPVFLGDNGNFGPYREHDFTASGF